ncbi:MAG: aquaporin [Acidobacteriota bacterium]|nr:aquaporin [Acidobacteriota bacterium]
MNKYLMELIGTFFLMLTVGLTAIAAPSGVIAPLAIGSALMIMVFAGGHISGGHYNPAVSLGVWMRGNLETKDLVPYWVSQLVGGLLAAGVVAFLKFGVPVSTLSPAVLPTLLAEFLFTFALVFVVLSTATAKGNAGNSFFGLAIGFTVMVGAFAVGDISGAAFNPAVVLGISVLGLVSWSSIWMYLLAELLAGVAAASAFQFINMEVAPVKVLTREEGGEAPHWKIKAG